MPTVRDAALRVLAAHGLTRMHANPGSTEVPLLARLPEPFTLVLGLHEGTVVGVATGEALATGRPALVLLHTTAGLGNAVGALATARANRAPLVVLVGQQDRRHLESEPFLAGRLEGLAGDYPVAVHTPSRAADVPGLLARAVHEAALRLGPVLVVVPMDDWSAAADDSVELPAPRALVASAGADPHVVADLVVRIDAASSPVVVTGSAADDPATWDALARLVDALDCRVWQEAHASRAAFDHTSPRFAGHLPAARDQLRLALRDHDLVVVVGGPAFRQYLHAEGRFVEPGTQVVVVVDDEHDALISACDLAVLAPLAATVDAVAERVRRRDRATHPARVLPPVPAPDGSGLRAEQVFAALADRLPAESTYVEECPSTRRQLLDLLPVRAPFGFTTPAMGGLGFALPAAAGIKLGRPDRPVVAVVGDGASLYNVQALWTAQRYGAGVLYVVLSNGGYAVMDRLAAAAGSEPAWPRFEDVSMAALARGLGCAAQRIESHDDLLAALDDVVPTLGARREPLVLDVAVAP